MTDLNPQREQMADESMVRNLAAQATCIWPQESVLFDRYALPEHARILDAGCGTGEISSRLTERFPRASVLAVDILDHHLAYARDRYARLAPRLTFEHRSIFELGLPDRSFDLVACRHVLQSIPHEDRAIAELARVTRAGGWLHLICEDYDMIHFQKSPHDARDFWYEAPKRFSKEFDSNLWIGRDAAPLLERLGLEDVRIDYVVVDTLRVPREPFARIFEAWRDGYSESVVQVTGWPEADVRAYFDEMSATIRDPGKYAVWFVPVVSGRMPR